MKLFDVHTHVQFAAFQDDYKDVIARALDRGVRMVNVGTQKDTSKRAIEIAKEYGEGVYASVGLHPIHTEVSFHDTKELGDGESAKAFTSRGEDFNYEEYKKLALDLKVVAIGECGLDYFRIKNNELRIKQEEALRMQIELALELKKPLMIHCREAFGDLIKILNSYVLIRNSNAPGIVHFFSGTKEDASKLLDMGFSFSFGGVITFPPRLARLDPARLAEQSRGEAGAKNYEELVKYIPMDRILLETDAPYVAPVPYRSKRNEPAYVIEVAKRVSEIKSINIEEAAASTTANAERIFFKNSL